MFSSETYAIEDCNIYTSDGTGLNGTFTTGDGYITGCQANVGLTPTGFPSNFQFSYEAYMNPGTTSYSNNNSLWRIGTDENNGILIGVESENKRIRIYNRVNNSNSSQQIMTDCFNYQEWVTVVIEYNSGVWKITIGSKSISYSKSFTPAILHLNAAATNTRLREVKVKPL